MKRACKTCGKCVSNLKEHARTHTGEKPYACQVEGCGYTCSDSSALAKHTRRHTGEKPYACQVEGCGYTYAQSQHLVTHARTHTGEKPYACQVEGCGKAFSGSGSLAKHTRTHTGEKPYACQVEACDKAFSESGHLVKHMRTHTGEKPYACQVEGCGYTCSDPSALVSHARTHTGEKPYACDMCKYTCTQSGNIASHKERIHDVGKHVCDYCLGNRNSRNKHHDDALGKEVTICRECFRKVTGFTSRVEQQWCEYVDVHLGTDGLMGSDNSMSAMGGCSRKRPDRLYGGPNLVEVDECDENQHRGVDYSCEQARITELYDEPSICGRPMVVIRWNPDGYTPPTGQPKVKIEQRLELFVKLKRHLRETRRLCDPAKQPRIVIYYMFYTQTNANVCKDIRHHFVYSENDF
jgi:hypothetical protein